MGQSRKQALKHLQGLLQQVELHLERIAADSDERALSHHRSEVRNWLQQMEEVLPHVGKKTAAEWQTHIDICRARLPY